MRKLLLGFAFLLICPILPGQQTLDNDAVMKLAKAGQSDDQIIATIKSSPGKYDISMYALDVMRKVGISEKVLEAIVRKESGIGPNIFAGTRPPARKTTGAAGKAAPVSPAAPSRESEPSSDQRSGTASAVTPVRAAAPSPETKLRADNGSGAAGSVATASIPAPFPPTGPNGLPVGINDAGVYLRDKNGAWVAMLPETVNFQSAAKIENIATAGILKSDLNGRIEGAHAQVNATLPLVFAIYLPQTFDITDYLLYELHPTANARTFLSAEGGLLHTKPGAHQDQIEFQPEKLAPRLYQITLPAIEGRGEYGLLAPGTKVTSTKEATGTIYTVSVTE
jgi:hypothetical protein